MGTVMARLSYRVLASLLICAPITGSPAKEKPQLDLSAYPEASPERALPEIMKGLRRFLKDPASISDFALCQPVAKFKIDKAGKLKFWTYLFSLNSKNALGGYTGLQHYSAIFETGKALKLSSISMPGSDGFASVGNMLIEKEMRKCDFLPKDEVQRLLAS